MRFAWGNVGIIAVAAMLTLAGCSTSTDAPGPATKAGGGFATTTTDSVLRKAVSSYCKNRTDGPGPDIPQLRAAGVLPADWNSRVDMVLNPTSGDSVKCGTGGGTYAFWTPSATSYPASVTGCNGTVSEIDGVPKRALSVDQISYQFALALGLEDSVYGYWPTRTDDLAGELKPLKAANETARPLDFRVESDKARYKAAGMGDNVNRSEQILAFRPDFIFTGDWFGWPMAFGWDGPLPLESNAAEVAPTYMGFTNNGWFCAASKDGGYDKKAKWSVAAKDARPQLTFEYLYADLRTLGIVFNAQNAAFDLIRKLKNQVSEAIDKAADSAEQLKASTLLVGYGDTVPASWDANKAQYYTQRDPINAVIAQLGMTNVWSSTKSKSVGGQATVEGFIAKKPDVIIMQSVYPDCRDVRKFIAKDPAWKQARVPAVINGKLVCTAFKDGYLGLGLPDMLSAAADTLTAR